MVIFVRNCLAIVIDQVNFHISNVEARSGKQSIKFSTLYYSHTADCFFHWQYHLVYQQALRITTAENQNRYSVEFSLICFSRVNTHLIRIFLLWCYACELLQYFVIFMIVFLLFDNLNKLCFFIIHIKVIK